MSNKGAVNAVSYTTRSPAGTSSKLVQKRYVLGFSCRPLNFYGKQAIKADWCGD
jgi:hypothetical protein